MRAAHKTKMKKSRHSKTRRRRKRRGNAETSAPARTLHNFVADAGPGCYIAMDSSAPWILGCETFDPCDYDDGVEVPDLALDPTSARLSVTNVHDDGQTRVCYVTVYETRVRGRDGARLISGFATDNEGRTRSCVTFIVLCPPLTFMHLCHLDVTDGKSVMDIDIDSDVQAWNRHPAPDDTHPQTVGFPLGGDASYLCTQGEGGELTHFFSGNLHAVDFRCKVGTPVLAVGDGVVTEVTQENTLTGVAVQNLFKWNSIMLQLDTSSLDSSLVASEPSRDSKDNQTNRKGSSSNSKQDSVSVKQPIDINVSAEQNGAWGPLYVEYVHIQENSARVKPGDRVQCGQVICNSGSVGFSPEPHLHFAAYRSNEPTAPTVRVKFQCGSGNPFVPNAGMRYDRSGLIQENDVETNSRSS